MSVEININDYSLQTRKQILSDLTICSNVNKYSETQSSFKLFEISKTNKNGVLVPFSYYYQFLKTSQRLEGNPEGFLKNIKYKENNRYFKYNESQIKKFELNNEINNIIISNMYKYYKFIDVNDIQDIYLLKILCMIYKNSEQ